MGVPVRTTVNTTGHNKQAFSKDTFNSLHERWTYLPLPLNPISLYAWIEHEKEFFSENLTWEGN